MARSSPGSRPLLAAPTKPIIDWAAPGSTGPAHQARRPGRGPAHRPGLLHPAGRAGGVDHAIAGRQAGRAGSRGLDLLGSRPAVPAAAPETQPEEVAHVGGRAPACCRAPRATADQVVAVPATRSPPGNLRASTARRAGLHPVVALDLEQRVRVRPDDVPPVPLAASSAIPPWRTVATTGESVGSAIRPSRAILRQVPRARVVVRAFGRPCRLL